MALRIAFAGKMGSGKTTAARYLADKHGFVHLSFADPIRELAKRVYGDVKNEERRKFMQAIGQAGRSVNPAVWISPIRNYIERHPDARVVIDDVRFVNELTFCTIHDFKVYRIVSGNRLTLLEQRDGFVPDDAVLRDLSETELDYYTLAVLRNDGTLDEFHALLDEVVKQIEAEDLRRRAAYTR